MVQNYTEQDTERARLLEQATSGQGSSLLGSSATSQFASIVRPKWSILVGLAALGCGGFLLMSGINSDDVVAGLILLTIASCLLFFGFWKRVYGLVVPGWLLAGLGLGISYASLTNGVSVVWGLALGFGAIFVVGRRLFGRQHFWPAIPGVILFGVGAIIALTSLPSMLVGGLAWIPLLLIAAGLYLGWGTRGR